MFPQICLHPTLLFAFCVFVVAKTSIPLDVFTMALDNIGHGYAFLPHVSKRSFLVDRNWFR